MAVIQGAADVAVTHKFVSGKADGADGTLVQPSKWNQNENLGAGADGQKIIRDSGQVDGAGWVDCETASFTNNTAAGATVGDVVAVSLAADKTVVLDDTVSSVRKFVVALQAPANGAPGAYGYMGPINGAKAQGAIAAGNYVRKSATSKAVEDTGIAVSSSAKPPVGTLGFATTAAAGGFVNVFWFPQTVTIAGTTVVQTVYGHSAGSTTASASFVDVTGATLSITPTSTASKILVLFSAGLSAAAVGGVNNQINAQLVSTFAGVVADGARSVSAPSGAGGVGGVGAAAWTYLESPGSVAAQTYKLQHLSTTSNNVTTSGVMMVLQELL